MINYSGLKRIAFPTQAPDPYTPFIQAAIGTGSVIRFLFHNLDGTSAQASWTVANFTSLMQYIARLRDGGVIDVPTWTEWYEQVKDERVPVATS